jgi:hypothetical protein
MVPQASVALGMTITPMLKLASAGRAPCARWFRWQIAMSGGLAWDITFRIWIAANRIGNRVAPSDAVSLADLERQGYWQGYGHPVPSGQGTQKGGGGGARIGAGTGIGSPDAPGGLGASGVGSGWHAPGGWGLSHTGPLGHDPK